MNLNWPHWLKGIPEDFLSDQSCSVAWLYLRKTTQSKNKNHLPWCVLSVDTLSLRLRNEQRCVMRERPLELDPVRVCCRSNWTPWTTKKARWCTIKKARTRSISCICPVKSSCCNQNPCHLSERWSFGISTSTFVSLKKMKHHPFPSSELSRGSESIPRPSSCSTSATSLNIDCVFRGTSLWSTLQHEMPRVLPHWNWEIVCRLDAESVLARYETGYRHLRFDLWPLPENKPYNQISEAPIQLLPVPVPRGGHLYGFAFRLRGTSFLPRPQSMLWRHESFLSWTSCVSMDFLRPSSVITTSSTCSIFFSRASFNSVPPSILEQIDKLTSWTVPFTLV